MSSWDTIVALCCAVMIAVMVGGCTARPSPDRPPAPIVAAECPADGVGLGVGSRSGPATGSRPLGFEPISILRCRLDQHQLPDPARITVIEERGRISSDLASALELDDRPRTAACPAHDPVPPYLLLVDATGRAYRPWLPRTGCTDTRPDVLSALDATVWSERRTFTVRTPG